LPGPAQAGSAPAAVTLGGRRRRAPGFDLDGDRLRLVGLAADGDLDALDLQRPRATRAQDMGELPVLSHPELPVLVIALDEDIGELLDLLEVRGREPRPVHGPVRAVRADGEADRQRLVPGDPRAIDSRGEL